MRSSGNVAPRIVGPSMVDPKDRAPALVPDPPVHNSVSGDPAGEDMVTDLVLPAGSDVSSSSIPVNQESGKWQRKPDDADVAAAKKDKPEPRAPVSYKEYERGFFARSSSPVQHVSSFKSE